MLCALCVEALEAQRSLSGHFGCGNAALRCGYHTGDSIEFVKNFKTCGNIS